jgi:CTD kinase subunit beta
LSDQQQDVCLAALLVSTKVEDTLKKLKDIQVAGFQIKSLQEGGSGQGEPDAQVKPCPS